jgi:hypothetical protein
MLKKSLLILALAAGTLLNSGCLGSLVLESNERKTFAELNLEREKAGLRSLTWPEYHNHGLTEDYTNYK